MLSALQSVAGALAAVVAGIAAGGAWVASVAAPNCSFDRLDYSRADGHVRQLLRDIAPQLAALLLAAAALSVLAGAFGAAVLSGLSAVGFFTNRWTLAPRDRSRVPPGVRQRKKSQRVVAVGFSLMFTGVAMVAAVLAAFGV